MKKGSSFVGALTFDFLSRPVGLTVRGKSTVHTKTGAVFSFVCLALYTTLSWVTITNYLDTSRPVISYESQSMKYKEKINIKKSKLFPILFFFDQVNYLMMEEVVQYVNPYIMYYRKSSTGAPVSVRLKLVPCSALIAKGKTDTITAESEGFVKTNYERFGLCVDDEDKVFTLGGAEVSDDFELFRVLLYPCALTDGTCKSQAGLGRLSFSVAFPTPMTNYGDYKSPIRYVTESNEFVGVSNVIYTVNYNTLRVNEVMQESGFLSKLLLTHHFVSIEKSTTQTRTRDSNLITCNDATVLSACTPYVAYNVIMTNNKMKIVRSYKGIVESISEIGGMIDLIFLLFMLLHSVHHSSVVKRFFIKEVYGIEKPASKPARCCRKKTHEVTSLRSESEAEQQELYNLAADRLVKDLDVIRILQELNTIKYFLATNFGLSASGELSSSKTLKGLDSFDHKKQEQKEDSKPSQKLSQQVLHQKSLKIPQPAIIKKESADSLFSKAMPVASTHGTGLKQQPSIKQKKSLFSSSKNIGYDPVDRPSQEPSEFNAQGQTTQKNYFGEMEN